MKRKRRGVHGSGNENLPTSSTYSRQISHAGLRNQAIPLRDCSDSTVPLTSVFNRVYQTIGSSPSTTTFDPLHAAQGSVRLHLTHHLLLQFVCLCHSVQTVLDPKHLYPRIEREEESPHVLSWMILPIFHILYLMEMKKQQQTYIVISIKRMMNCLTMILLEVSLIMKVSLISILVLKKVQTLNLKRTM
uniref:Uncharacterized protein n=1 Tax=Brassica campestris TaxID=3711 RepID=A0A3P6BB31_BRACM|nr:unnamed protein product [Brassica rapa]